MAAEADRKGNGSRRESVALTGGHRLEVERTPGTDVLRIEGGDGRLRLSVVVTAAGPVVHLDGADLFIRSGGALAIDAESIQLRGREGVTLDSGRDAEVRVAGHLRTVARSQEMVANLGDVSVYANDDVKLDGERIRMNC